MWTQLLIPTYMGLQKVSESFHTRAASKLQWRIAIAIFELPSVHTREKTSLSLWFSIPEREEEAWLASDMLIAISFATEFLLENMPFIGGKG